MIKFRTLVESSYGQMGAGTTTAQQSNTTMDAGDAAYSWLKANHPEVHDYIRVDSPVPIDPVQTRQAVQAYGPAKTLQVLKGHVAQDTKKIWEPVVGQGYKDLVREEVVTEALDPEITWNKHGAKASARMKEEGVSRDIHDTHKDIFIDRVHGADPTEHKEYAPWLASRYASGGINKFEDFDRAHGALAAFHKGKVKKQLTKNGINADINTYKHLSDLEDAVDKIPQEVSKKDEIKSIKENEATRHESDHWTTIVPHSKAASCAYGAGTRWCTAATNSHNYFDHYNKDGAMHILIPKKPKFEGEKYQYHYHSNQLMDPKDHAADGLDVFHGRPNPVVMDHIENSSGGNVPSSGKHHAQMIQIAHDPHKYIDKYASSSTHQGIQSAIATYGSDSQKEELAKNPNASPSVKSGLIRGNPSKFAGHFLNDRSDDVHKAIMAHGTNEHVSSMLSSNGHLSNDLVIQALQKNPDHADHFVKSPSPLFRALAAKHGRDSHRESLKDDPSFLVQSVLKGGGTI